MPMMFRQQGLVYGLMIALSNVEGYLKHVFGWFLMTMQQAGNGEIKICLGRSSDVGCACV